MPNLPKNDHQAMLVISPQISSFFYSFSYDPNFSRFYKSQSFFTSIPYTSSYNLPFSLVSRHEPCWFPDSGASHYVTYDPQNLIMLFMILKM